VTFNLDDFPAVDLEKYGMESQHPDDFISHLLDLDPGAVCAAAKRQRSALKKPPMSVEQFLETLAQQRLPETVGRLREFAELL
jgi:hypothetical protein